MVVLTSTNLKLNTTHLLEKLPINDFIIKIEKRGILRRGESSRDKIRRRAKQEVTASTGFGHNSITLVVLNNGDGSLPMKEITIKIFQNGVFHMTGVLDDLYDTCSLKQLLDCIWNEHPECIIDPPEKWEIVRRRVVLMNYTTEVSPKHTIPRESLYRSIQGLHNEQIVASYDPDVYPGVKIQFLPNKWTAKVFRTGKIILTGVTAKEDCTILSEMLSDLLKRTCPQES
jgi:hypothetical protein